VNPLPFSLNISSPFNYLTAKLLNSVIFTYKLIKGSSSHRLVDICGQLPFQQVKPGKLSLFSVDNLTSLVEKA